MNEESQIEIFNVKIKRPKPREEKKKKELQCHDHNQTRLTNFYKTYETKL